MVCEYDTHPHDGPCRWWRGSVLLVAQGQPLEAVRDDLEPSRSDIVHVGNVGVVSAGSYLDADQSVIGDVVLVEELAELANGEDLGFVRHGGAPYRSEP